jgi:methionyl aminopeptidase
MHSQKPQIKSKEEIAILKEGGRRLASLLLELALNAKIGVSSLDLDNLAFSIIEKNGDKPSFLNYKARGSKVAYPASVCISVNDEVVHGVPNINPRIFKEGDIVSIDGGIIHNGLFTDSAITVPVGKISEADQKLLNITKESLYVGIKEARVGNFTGDIGFAIENFVKPHGYGIIRELAGHGVGYAVHEDPFIPNYGKKGEGSKLFSGMVIAIEPMLNIGKSEIILASDGFTYKTRDGSKSAHFEHTVAILDNGPEILTRI